MLGEHSTSKHYLQTLKTRIRKAGIQLGRRWGNASFLVLAEHIMQNIEAKHSSIADLFDWIDLPYLFSASSTMSPDISNQLLFAFLGSPRKQKGYELFEQLATDVKRRQRQQNQRVPEFALIGAYKREGAVFNSDVLYPPSNTKLAPAEYSRFARRAQYFVFPYNPEKYDYTASAALLDAFLYERPVIALRSSMFESYFKRFGEIGYLCDTYEDMYQQVVEICSHDTLPSEYLNQVEALRRGKDAFNPNRIAEKLADLYKPTD